MGDPLANGVLMGAEQPRAVVVVLDGLGSGYLGPYGNTWIETPAFNELAGQSCLFEQAVVDSPSLDALLRSFWTGRHAASGDLSPESPPNLLEQLGHRSCSTLLITDEPDCAGHPVAAAFERIQLIADDEHPVSVTAEETGIARVVAETIDSLSPQVADLTWVHSRALQHAWDAPWEFRRQFADEDDPDPPTSVEPPAMCLGPDDDPDVVQGWLWAYAGQIVLLDLCLQPLLNALDALEPSPLLVVTGARGYPLGEHGAFGAAATGLYSELLQVPLLIRLPTRDAATRRIPNLVQPADLCFTLARWFGLATDSAVSSPGLWPLLRETAVVWPEFAVSSSQGEWALRTPAWLARFPNRSGDPTTGTSISSRVPEACELFLKPDDRWDVNDVSDRCPDVVQAYHRLLIELQASKRQAGWPHNVPLETILFHHP